MSARSASNTSHNPDLLIAACALVFATPGILLWLAGGIGAWIGHGRWPAVPLIRTVVLDFGVAHHLSDPALAWPASVRALIPGAVWLYLLFFVLAAFPCAGAGYLWHRLKREHKTGFAKRSDLHKHLSTAAVRRRAPQVRPGLSARRSSPAQFGVYLGRDSASGSELWASLEDSFLILGPPRSNKSASIVIPGVLDAPGPAIVTSIRPDILRATAGVRKKPIEVFDPQGSSGWPRSLRWSPVAGCEDPLTAILRARGFAAGAGFSDNTTNAEFWSASAAAVIRCYLHAAALGERSMAEVVGWAGRPRDTEPVRILRADPRAAPGWGDELESQARTDPRTRDGVWSGVRRAFDCLADPRVLGSCSASKDDAFDAEEFLEEGGTLYVVGSSGAQLSVAPLITALVEDLADRALKVAHGSSSGRLDPPLSLWLDEVANIAPLDSLPSLLSGGGGSGICTVVVLQSLAQARSRWGEDRADQIWDNSTVRVVFGGLGHAEDLTRISRLAGEVDDQVVGTTRGAGGTTWSTNPRSRPVLPLERLRSLPEGRAVILHRRTPFVEAVIPPWWQSPRAKVVRRSLAETERRCGGTS